VSEETPQTPEDENVSSESAPADGAAGSAQEEAAAEEQGTRAASSSETDSEPAADNVEPDETPAPEPVAADQPEEAPAAEEAEVVDETVGEEAVEGPTASADDEAEYEPEPRHKPEIPGADLDVFLPQEEEQYLDAEARAAAEAEAEAEALRAAAEAEAEQARPIADAAIDLAAGARYSATGKRKTAVARVVLRPGTGEYLINGRSLDIFFPRETLRRMIRQPLETVGYESRMDVVARMHGGGVSAQAGALRHGISRALIEADPNLRGELKRRGFLTRDPRVKERKKAGLKKARKRPQFSKR
jgi:small subunit ribosomal protein S9